MPQPQPEHVISPPAHPGQPYDANAGGALGPWRSVEDNSGPADIHDGHVTGDFPDSAPWRQV